jgi:phage-related minor tail protein
MSQSLATVNIALRANLKDFQKGMQKASYSLKAMGKQMQGVGRNLSIGLTAPLSAFGVTAVQTFRDFELQMAKVQSVSGATGDELKKLTEDAKRLGASTVFSASQVAELQTEFAKLGFSSAEILKVTESTLQLAQAFDMDLGRAAEVAGSTLRAFGMEADETSRITDVMAASFGSTALDVESFAEAMKYVAPVANAAGISIEETTAMLGTLANSGVKGSQAGTALRRIISEIGATGEPVADAISRLAAEGLNLGTAMDEVGRSAQSALLILGEGVQSTSDLTAAFNDSNGATAKMAQILDGTLNGALKGFQSAWEGVQIAVGDVLAQYLEPLLRWFAKALQGFQSLSDGTKKMIVGLGLLAAAIGPLILLMGPLASGLSALSAVAGILAGITAPVAAVAAAIAGAVALIITHWDEIRAYFSQGEGSAIFQRLADDVGAIMQSIQKIFKKAVQAIGWIWDEFGDQILSVALAYLQPVLDLFSFFIRQLRGLLEIGVAAIEGRWGDAWAGVQNMFIRFANFITTQLANLLRNMLQPFASISRAVGMKGMAGAVETAIKKVEGLAESMQIAEIEISKTAERVGEADEALQDHSSTLKKVKKGVDDLAGSYSRLMPQESTVNLAPKAPELISKPTGEIKRDPEVSAEIKTDLQEIAGGMSLVSELGNEMGSAFMGAFDDMGDSTESAWERMGQFFKNLIKRIGMAVLAASALTAVLAPLGLAFGAKNAGGQIFSGLFSSLGGFTIPGLATGGIVTSPTLAVVGEGSEPEAVLPLSRLRSMLGANQMSNRIQISGEFALSGSVARAVINRDQYNQTR